MELNGQVSRLSQPRPLTQRKAPPALPGDKATEPDLQMGPQEGGQECPGCPPTSCGQAQNSKRTNISQLPMSIWPLKGREETWRNRRKTEAVSRSSDIPNITQRHGLQGSKPKTWAST